jgi:hypothetical protein
MSTFRLYNKLPWDGVKIISSMNQLQLAWMEFYPFWYSLSSLPPKKIRIGMGFFSLSFIFF